MKEIVHELKARLQLDELPPQDDDEASEYESMCVSDSISQQTESTAEEVENDSAAKLWQKHVKEKHSNHEESTGKATTSRKIQIQSTERLYQRKPVKKEEVEQKPIKKERKVKRSHKQLVTVPREQLHQEVHNFHSIFIFNARLRTVNSPIFLFIC